MADKVVSGVAVDYVGMKVRVKYNDSSLNSDRIIRLCAGRTRFVHVCAAFNCIYFAADRKQLVTSRLACL